MPQMTAVSLFAGIGGFDRAFESAGVRVVAAVEIDPAARGVIHDRMPDTTLFTDVCEVTPDDLIRAGFDPANGVLTGGWPCQDLSVAGRRLGLGGARSGLVWEVIRLLSELRPRWFCLENVPGLLSAVCPCLGGDERTCDSHCDTAHPVRGGACGHIPGRGRCAELHAGAACPCLGGDERVCGTGCDTPHAVNGGACRYVRGAGQCMELHGGAMGAVLGAMAELGYGIAYRVLDAQHFGVPQRRRRVVLVGCLGDWAAPAEILLEPEGGGGDPAPRRAAGAGTAVVSALRAGSGGGCGPDDNDATGGCLIATALRASNHHGDHAGAESHLVPTLTAGMGSNVGHPGDAGKDDIILAVAATLTARSASGRTPGRRREDDENIVVAPALTARYGKGTDSDATDSLLPFAFDTAQITSAENRVNPQPGDPSMPLAATGSPHVAFALRADPGGTGQVHNTTFVPIGGDGVAHALTAVGHDASEDGTGRGTPLVPVKAIAFDWKTDGTDRTRPNISTERTSTLGTTKQDAVAYQCQGSNVGPAGALRRGNGHATGGVPFLPTTTAVRRLTPTECERLQGYPDGWTATSWGKPQADSPRYRQLGNSVAVPVFAWVARHMVRCHEGEAK